MKFINLRYIKKKIMCLLIDFFMKKKKFFIFFIIGIIVSIFNLFLIFVFVSILNFDKKLIAPSFSLEISIILSFFLNDNFTFKSKKMIGFKKQNFFFKLFKFHLAALSGFILNLIIYNIVLVIVNNILFIDFIFKYDYIIAQIVAMSLVVFWNYFINSRWTWKN